jgi:hypothetical protein
MNRPSFTKGPWRLGNNGWSVISDHPTSAFSGSKSEIDYYGGNLICESVAAENRPLITAAPDLYDFIATLENDDGKIPDWLWAKREALLAKARGEAS